jgi:hypothetical protein
MEPNRSSCARLTGYQNLWSLSSHRAEAERVADRIEHDPPAMRSRLVLSGGCAECENLSFDGVELRGFGDVEI